MVATTLRGRLQSALNIFGGAWKSGYNSLWVSTGFWTPIPTITFQHIYTHAGLIFTASKLWDTSNEVVDDATADILIQTGSDAYPHIIFNLSVAGNSEFYLYEDTTVSAAGTVITPINRNRTKSTTFNSTITHTPTVTDVGTVLLSEFLPGGSGAKPQGSASDNFDAELVLDVDTNYLLRVKNVSGGAISISYDIGITEVPTSIEMW